MVIKNTHISRPAAEMIEAALNGLASSEEGAQVAAWLATAEGQQCLSQLIDNDFARIKKGCEELSVNHAIPSEAMYRCILKRIRQRRKKRMWLRAAAVLLPFALLLAMFVQLNSRVNLLGKNEYAEVYIPKGERVQLLFQDGSKAYVNADTKIRYPKQFGLSERKMYLEGEAYFVVSPNAKRPFIVVMDEVVIRVLGTSFNVSAYPEDKYIHVNLDEGKVNLISRAKKDNFLNASEKLIYNKESDQCSVVKNPDTRSVSLWKQDVIAFRNASLQDVVKTLNRWYNVQFVIEDPRAYTYTYTFTSENTLLEKVLGDMEKIAPVKFSYEDDIVKISMK